jgi:endonuclease YncB( thermonuclease family)
MSFLDDCLLGLTGKNWAQLNEPLRRKWNEARWLHGPLREHGSWAYNAVPRADLVLTAFGTALTVMATRRAFRRFRTAQEIPLEHFRKQKKLKGYIISVNDSDNVRFYHTSFLSRLFFRRPSIKRSDVKYETINVRLAGIDAPEMAHFGGDCQPYAKEAKEWLTKFAEGRRATIQLLRYDQYSRAVASVYTGWPWNSNVSVEMVKAGFATIYEDGGAEYGGFEPQLRKNLKEAQYLILCAFLLIMRVRAKRKGMWKQSWATYVSPSQYKKNLRLSQDSAGSSSASPTPQNGPSDKWKPLKWAFWK